MAQPQNLKTRTSLTRLVLLGVILCAGGIKSYSQAGAAPMSSSIPDVSTPFASAHTIRYEGVASDSSGNPLRLGTHGFRFAIYSTPSGGTALWQEFQNIIVGQKGAYTAILGSTSTDGVPASVLSPIEPRYLGIQIDSLPELPSVLITAVPYSVKAGDADTLGGKAASQYATVDQLAKLNATKEFAGDQNISGILSATAVSTSALSAASASFGSLSATGDATVQGNITAQKLQGDGSGLSNVNAVKVGDIAPADIARQNARNAFSQGQTLTGGATLASPLPASATSTDGFSSSPLDLVASAYNSATSSAENQIFRWIAEPVNSNTAKPSARLSLWFGNSSDNLSPTGFVIDADGSTSITSIDTKIVGTGGAGSNNNSADTAKIGADTVDGKHALYTSIQSAVTAAQLAAGGEVTLPCGTYSLPSEINFDTAAGPLTLTGSGKCTVLRVTGSSNRGLHITGTPGITRSKFVLRNFSMVANTSGITPALIHLDGASNYDIENVTLDGNGGKATYCLQISSGQQGEIHGGATFMQGCTVLIRAEDVGGIGSNQVEIHGISLSATQPGSTVLQSTGSALDIHSNQITGTLTSTLLDDQGGSYVNRIYDNFFEQYQYAIKSASRIAAWGNQFQPTGGATADLWLRFGATRSVVGPGNSIAGGVRIDAGADYSTFLYNISADAMPITDNGVGTSWLNNPTPTGFLGGVTRWPAAMNWRARDAGTSYFDLDNIVWRCFNGANGCTHEFTGTLKVDAKLNAGNIYATGAAQYFGVKDGASLELTDTHIVPLTGLDIGTDAAPFHAVKTLKLAGITDTGVVSNLNADRLDGKHASDFVSAAVVVPAHHTDACTSGTWAHDSNFLYICNASGDWRRIAWNQDPW
jgi:hypothetical protein